MNIDPHLSNTAINYRPAGFIADRILPVVRVPVAPKILAEKATRMSAELNLNYSEAVEYVLRQNPGLASAYRDYTINPISVPDKYYSIKVDVTMEDRDNADPLFVQQFEEGRIMRCLDALNLDWEIRVATLVTNPTNVGLSFEAGSDWSDYSNSDPMKDLQEAIDSVKTVKGRDPNKILFSGTAWRHFRRNPKVMIKAGDPGLAQGGLYPSTKQVEDLLEMDVMVGNAWYNSAEETQSIDLRQVWQDHVLVYYTPEHPDVDVQSFGYNLRFGEIQVERLPYDSRRRCSELEISYSQDEMIKDKNLGCLIMGTTKEQG